MVIPFIVILLHVTKTCHLIVLLLHAYYRFTENLVDSCVRLGSW